MHRLYFQPFYVNFQILTLLQIIFWQNDSLGSHYFFAKWSIQVILGFQHTKHTSHVAHVDKLKHKATLNLHKLYRFKHAPSHIKLTLYKTLIRPLLEYPPIMTATASDTQTNKLQIIQNKALRFIYNIHWQDHVTNNSLHHRSKLAPVKDRLVYLRNSHR